MIDCATLTIINDIGARFGGRKLLFEREMSKRNRGMRRAVSVVRWRKTAGRRDAGDLCH